jgi:hypothetical protein
LRPPSDRGLDDPIAEQLDGIAGRRIVARKELAHIRRAGKRLEPGLVVQHVLEPGGVDAGLEQVQQHAGTTSLGRVAITSPSCGE